MHRWRLNGPPDPVGIDEAAFLPLVLRLRQLTSFGVYEHQID